MTASDEEDGRWEDDRRKPSEYINSGTVTEQGKLHVRGMIRDAKHKYCCETPVRHLTTGNEG